MKQLKTIFIIIFLCNILVIPINAEVETLGTFKQNECINLLQSGTGFTSCNITSVYNENSPIPLIQEVVMDQDNTEYNYTFCNTSELGKYIINGFCTNGTANVVWVYDLKVNITGDDINLFNIVIVIAFMILTLILFLIGNSFSKEQWIIKTAFYIFALFSVLLAINSAGIIASESAALSKMRVTGIVLTIIVLSFMALYLFINWTVQTVKQLKNKKEIRWQY